MIRTPLKVSVFAGAKFTPELKSKGVWHLYMTNHIGSHLRNRSIYYRNSNDLETAGRVAPDKDKTMTGSG